jgi:AcrR family transcriptional regulator
MEKNELSTRQRILESALALFSERGFELVTVAEIAEAVKIKAPSLYKHYKSKRDIFDAIIEEMDSRYKRQTADMKLDGKEAENDKEFFLNIDDDGLVKVGTGLFIYMLHDDYISKFRKMLTLEQYRNKELAAIYEARQINDALAYHSAMFKTMSDAGVIINEDPQVTALQFYSPIFILLNICDADPERESGALQMLERHIRQFCRLYRCK